MGLLLVGINPGLRSAERNRHFAGPGNRFWPALAAAGVTPRLYGPDEQHLLPELGIGITNLVTRESARADELSRDELRAGAAELTVRVERLRPVVVAVLGVTAYRVAFGRPRATVGPQADALGPARVWLLANTSGLNASWQVDDHAAELRSAATDAGIVYRANYRANPQGRGTRTVRGGR